MTLTIQTITLTIHPLSFTKMPPKRKPLPLHVSLHRIEEERRNMEKRTQLRITQLHLKENSDGDNKTLCESDVFMKGRQVTEWHCCLNIFGFCLTLILFNLLFLQWLYIKVTLKDL
jgi:hypothetical protein